MNNIYLFLQKFRVASFLLKSGMNQILLEYLQESTLYFVFLSPCASEEEKSRSEYPSNESIWDVFKFIKLKDRGVCISSKCSCMNKFSDEKFARSKDKNPVNYFLAISAMLPNLLELWRQELTHPHTLHGALYLKTDCVYKHLGVSFAFVQ